MSNFLTQFSSGDVVVDASFITMIISMILLDVAASIRLNARLKYDAEPAGDVESIEIVALIMCAISLAILVIAGLITDTPMSVAQCILVIVASLACAAPLIINFALMRLRHAEEQSDSDA